MARNVGSVIQNNLSRGVITEATGLNFPDNAAVDSENVVFDPIGSARRRKGFDIEGSAVTTSYDESDGLIKEFVWQSVARTGGFTFLVLQMGSTVLFYELTQSEALSAGIRPVGLDLNQYKSPGAGDLRLTPCTFSSGAGYLFIAHPMCDPIIVRWNEDTEDFESAKVHIRIRDFEGVEDTEGLLDNPVSLTTPHHYNLRNQGWNQMVRVGANSNEIGQGGSLGGNSIASDPLVWVPLVPPVVVRTFSGAFSLGGGMRTAASVGARTVAKMALGGVLGVNLQVGQNDLRAIMDGGGEFSTPITIVQKLQSTYDLGGAMRSHIYPPTTLRATVGLEGTMEATVQVPTTLQAVYALGGESSINLFNGKILGATMALEGAATVNVEVTEAGRDADAQAIIDEMVVTPDETRQDLIENLVLDLKAAGVWTKLDRLLVLAAADEQSALIEWKDPSRTVTKVNTPTFTTDVGFTRTATDQFINVSFPVGENYALNAATIGVYSGFETGGINMLLGSDRTSGGFVGLTLRSTPDMQAFLNDTSGNSVARVLGNALYTARRSGTTKNYYKNGVNFGGTVQASTGLPIADNFQVFGGTSTGGVASIAFIGGDLISTEISDLYDAINTYLSGL